MSSSLNSIAATSVNDLYRPFRQKLSDAHYLKVSHWLTLLWGVVQIGVALLVRNQNRSALDQALSVASLINGPVLGVFLVGVFLKRVSEPPALIGMLASMAAMIYIRFATRHRVDVVCLYRQPHYAGRRLAGKFRICSSARESQPAAGGFAHRGGGRNF